MYEEGVGREDANVHKLLFVTHQEVIIDAVNDNHTEFGSRPAST